MVNHLQFINSTLTSTVDSHGYIVVTPSSHILRLDLIHLDWLEGVLW